MTREHLGDTSDFDAYRPSKAEIKAFYKSAEWLWLSYQIKVAYGRQCQCCGRRPGDGAVITTDHIRSVKNYWHLRLTETNLQVLCELCNLGKGSRDRTDFRLEPRAIDAVMMLLCEKIGLANLHEGGAAAKAIIRDASSYGEISNAQAFELCKQFELGTA